MRPKKIGFDSDIEEIPLNQYVNGRSKPIQECSAEKLRRYSIQTCEFCEAKCENRYDMLIHNSTHIIIPLLKESPCRCYKCNYVCISEEHLVNHLLIKHNIKTETKEITNVVPERAFNEEFETEEHCTDDETLDAYIQKEQFDNEDALLKGFFLNCKVDIEKFDTPWLVSENDSRNSENIISNSYEAERSKDCVVKLEQLPGLLRNDFVELSDRVDNDLSCVKSEFMQSVHYSELMKPGIYPCRLCVSKRFPTRYDLIVHEAIHLDLSKVFKKRQGRPRRCLQSNVNQVSSHDKYRCHICYEEFTLASELDVHLKSCIYKKNVRVCDICLNGRIDVEYSVVSTSYDLRYICCVCGKHYSELTVIRLSRQADLRPKQSIVDRIQFEDTLLSNIESGVNKAQCGQFRRKRNILNRKPMNNNERLKMIQNRLKLIKQSPMYASTFAKKDKKLSSR